MMLQLFYLMFFSSSLQLLEVTVGQLDIMVHDVFSGNLGFLDVIHVAEGVQLLAKPLPDRYDPVISHILYKFCPFGAEKEGATRNLFFKIYQTSTCTVHVLPHKSHGIFKVFNSYIKHCVYAIVCC